MMVSFLFSPLKTTVPETDAMKGCDVAALAARAPIPTRLSASIAARGNSRHTLFALLPRLSNSSFMLLSFVGR